MLVVSCIDTSKLFIMGQIVSVLQFLAIQSLSNYSPLPSEWRGYVKGGKGGNEGGQREDKSLRGRGEVKDLALFSDLGESTSSSQYLVPKGDPSFLSIFRQVAWSRRATSGRIQIPAS